LTFVVSPLAALRLLAAVLFAGLLQACTTTDFAPTAKPAPQPLSSRYAAIVVDANSGRTLYQASADETRYPASLTKMMTIYMLFEALDSGRVTKATPIPVSAYAASRPPTKIGVKPGQSITVDEAIKALVTKSANDAACAVGEFLGGSEAGFAAMMTARARQLGMSRTTFRNASGLPDAGQQTSARDMAVLGIALRKRFPHHYGYFSTRDFAYQGRMIRGHNDLIGRVRGVDGIKTGYIRASGFNIVTSVDRDGRKLVAVVMGGESARSRNAHVEELIERYLPAASARGGSFSALAR
jgi:D-alanyl-D-alanine carboxypeptidase